MDTNNNNDNDNNFMFMVSNYDASLQTAVTLDLLALAAVILCVVTAFFLVLVLSHIVLNLFSRLHEMRPSHGAAEPPPQQAVLHRSLARYNALLIEMLERFVQDVDEGRGQRLRALKRLPPITSYGRCEKRARSSSVDECVICLEDFEDGQTCQAFPVCNHVFHSNCIDHWLKYRLTCPVCRHCVLDV